MSTAGNPSGTAATASATAKMMIAGARSSPFRDDAEDAKGRGEQQHPARDLTAESIDAPFERRLGGLDVAEHASPDGPCALDATGPRHLEIGLAADEQRAAEGFVAVVLVDGRRIRP